MRIRPSVTYPQGNKPVAAFSKKDTALWNHYLQSSHKNRLLTEILQFCAKLACTLETEIQKGRSIRNAAPDIVKKLNPGFPPPYLRLSVDILRETWGERSGQDHGSEFHEWYMATPEGRVLKKKPLEQQLKELEESAPLMEQVA